MESRGLFSASK